MLLRVTYSQVFITSNVFIDTIHPGKKGKAVPLHAMEALGGEEI
jgi:hypothetical protein